MASKKQAKCVRYVLRHPLNDCPATADFVDYYFINGRAIGLKLLFPDGHLANLTYQEIAALQGDDDVSE